MRSSDLVPVAGPIVFRVADWYALMDDSLTNVEAAAKRACCFSCGADECGGG